MMRKKFLAISMVGFMALVLMLSPTPQAAGGDFSEKYLKDAADGLTGLLKKALEDGYKMQDGFSFAGGWLKKDQKKWVSLFYMDLKKGVSYRFLAAGDKDAKDVDLRVIDADGNVLKEDVGTAPDAQVDFTPTVAAKYTIQVRLYESDGDVPCVCLVSVLSK
jgi:hypothetical protein